MLHELLFALMGYPGDVFIPYPPHPNPASTFAIPSDFPLLHPAERDCLNRLAHIGWIYLQINEFTTSVKELRSTTTANQNYTNKPHGAYVLALVTSIETTLNEYRQDILDMETRILNRQDEAGSNVVPLSLLTANLSRWELLLPALWKLIQVLQAEPAKYHGCKLFDLLMDQAKSGVLEFRLEIEKMMVQLHNVLYRQLTAWMVYGQWTDPHHEFFIIPHKARSTTTPTTATATIETTTGWNRLYIIDYEMVPSHLSHSLVDSILFVGKAIATVNEMNKLSASISQHDDNNPLSPDTARSMRLMAQNHSKIVIPEDMRKKHLQLLSTLHSSNKSPNSSSSPWIRYPQELKVVVGEVRKSTADWLFSKVLVDDHGLHRYLNSFRHLFLLNYGDLAANFIQECQSWRRRSLIRSSSSTSTVSNHLNNRNKSDSHKSSSGSTNNDNIGRVSPSVNRNPSKTALIFRHQELNALLGKSSIGTDAEDQLNGFSLLLDEEQTKEYPFSDLLLMDLRVVLTYDLEWPIDLFLGESDLKNYSNLWSFLISLKNTQMMLNNLWKTLRNGNDGSSVSISAAAAAKENTSPAHQRQLFSTMHRKTAMSMEDDDGYQERLVWRLRSLMLFWIDTLLNHIQAHVIDYHYQQLIDTTTPAPSDDSTYTAAAKRRSFQPKAKLDFEEIQAAHEHFLTNTMRGCLLTSDDCIKTVYSILKTCSSFCDLMERTSEEGEWRRSKRRKTTIKTAAEIVSQWIKSNGNASWLDEVKKIEEEFTASTEQFFNLASAQQLEIKASGRLDVLLMQLDYNKWFSSQSTKAKLYPNAAPTIL